MECYNSFSEFSHGIVLQNLGIAHLLVQFSVLLATLPPADEIRTCVVSIKSADKCGKTTS